ncbi:MAG: hypothetical protein PHO42_01920 [Candidatus Omnitrophica bacterium]|nr:hypothetical protein [Candidatus Omnitrophota bacterium]
MKKVTLICLEKDSSGVVSDLRRMGVLHIENTQRPQGQEIDKLKEDLAMINTAAETVVSKEYRAAGPRTDKKITDALAAAKRVVELKKHLEQLINFSESLYEKILQLEAWGDFDPRMVKGLAKKNIVVRFYRIPIKEKNLIPENVAARQISAKGGTANYMVISRGHIPVPCKEFEMPESGLSELRKKYDEDKGLINKIKTEIGSFACYHNDFLSLKSAFESELEFNRAVRGMGREGQLSYLSGYAPYDKMDDLRAFARKEKLGIMAADPSEQDDVPVLIRDPRWISLISPIFKFLEILPGYHELDISLPFLIFFSAFFGILIGDAGYGLVYMVITFFFHTKAKKKGWATSSFPLFYVLSACAVIWGALTGTFFGHEWFIKIGYKPLIPALNDMVVFQRFCFFLGAFHLSLAHIWRAKIKLPSLSALSDIGWICILWASFFLARVLILRDAFPGFVKWLIATGVFLVIFFTNPQRNILKTLGEGLGALALSLMNNFTDVVSYIRLFAVGLAGIAISDTFNSMAGLLGKGSLLAVIGSVIIIVIGQGLGVILGPVSVLVHGVRLNVLEFSGHANISWSGNPYKPLKE